MKKYKIEVYEIGEWDNGPAPKYGKPKIVTAQGVTQAFQKALRMGFKFFGGNKFLSTSGMSQDTQRIQYGQFTRRGSAMSGICSVEAVEI